MVDQNLKAIFGNIVLFEGAGKDFSIEKHTVRNLQPGEILVKNLYTTICGSDLHTYCGLRQEPSPTVLGHEIVGEILEIAIGHSGFDLRGKQLKKGDRVTWSIFASDPYSPNAIAGIPQKGDNIFKYGHALATEPDVFHGGLGEYCILRDNTAILKLPESMPLSVAATLNCSVSTVAGALRMAGSVKGKNIFITGMGHLGITCAAMCREAGAAWIGAGDIEDIRLAKAKGFGIDQAFNLTTEKDKLVSFVKSSLPGKGIDVVFDMSGSPDAMELGLDLLAIGGISVWIGAVFNTRKLQVNAEYIIRNLITIKGLHNYNLEDFSNALVFMKKNWNKFPFTEAVEKEFPLEAVHDAFEYAVHNKPLRVGVKVQ